MVSIRQTTEPSFSISHEFGLNSNELRLEPEKSQAEFSAIGLQDSKESGCELKSGVGALPKEDNGRRAIKKSG